jgi:asparagine synthase (glutamine-hydrolysing)
MCGIAAIISLKTGQGISPESERQCLRMAEAMRYRGPNAVGSYLHAPLGALGHARLSIIDLSDSANQPFVSSTGRSVIAFNGEIYNYLELREELEREHRYPFRTKSDTEVLLAAYEIWGESCVSRFNGMWAFVIFDLAQQTVFCSRDRFGVKPFLYAKQSDRLIIASEAKAILEIAPEFRKPNFTALSLVLRASIGGQNYETCFEGINRLPPAHNLSIFDGKIKTNRYWDYPCEGQSSLDESSAVDQFRALLTDSIKLRMRSDAPIGLTLSGGLDSSAITRIASENSSKVLKAYTAGYNHPNYQEDETALASIVASRCNVELVHINTTADDILPGIQKLVFHLESPHAATPIISYLKIMERAKEDVDVLIEGQGADELLGGYTDSIAYPVLRELLSRGDFSGISRTLRLGLSGKFGQPGLSFAAMLLRTSLRVPGLHYAYRTRRGDEAVYTGELRSETADNWQTRSFPVISGNHLRSALKSQHENVLVNLLQYGDAIPMAYSIEGRLPFMDYRLVEFAYQLPSDLLFRNGHTKYIVRRAMTDQLPAEVVWNKQKRGFDAPIAEWFRDRQDEIVKPILLSPECRQRGLFDSRRMERLLQRHKARKVDVSSQIFRWLATELWFREFID